MQGSEQPETLRLRILHSQYPPETPSLRSPQNTDQRSAKTSTAGTNGPQPIVIGARRDTDVPARGYIGLRFTRGAFITGDVGVVMERCFGTVEQWSVR